MDDIADDLGLDKPIKLGRVLKIAKLTDDLLFDRLRGVPQVVQNYNKLSRTLRKNDRRLAEKLAGSSKTASRALKVAAEVQNLESVLEFYQLWCHGLFPRANFQDCVLMLRGYKSFRLRDYRKELITKEIHLLKVAKGIITEDVESDQDLYTAPDIAAVDAPEESAAPVADVDDDDWSFMNAGRGFAGNGLFVLDNEEEEQVVAKRRAVIEDDEDDVNIPESLERPEEDPFSDDDDLPSFTQVTQSEKPSAKDNEDIPDENDFEEDRYNDEMDIMREMGL